MKSGILDKIFEALYKKSRHGREMEDTNTWLSEIHKPALDGIKGQQIKLDIDSVKNGECSDNNKLATIEIGEGREFVLGIEGIGYEHAFKNDRLNNMADIDTIIVPDGCMVGRTESFFEIGGCAVYYGEKAYKKGFAYLDIPFEDLDKKGYDVGAEYFYMRTDDVNRGCATGYINVYGESPCNDESCNLDNYRSDNEDVDNSYVDVIVKLFEYKDKTLQFISGYRTSIPAAYKGKNPDFLVVENTGRELTVRVRNKY